MANYNEVYQPPSEDGPVYDLHDDEIEESRGRLPLLIVVSLLMLGAFGGVVWLAYHQGMERGRAVAGSPPVIAAPPGLARTAPEEAGGGVPYTGLSVYSEPVPPDQEAETSTLAQAPITVVSDISVPPPPPPAAPAEPAPERPQLDPAAPQIAALVSAVSGAAVIQVGAFASEVEALQAWDNFQIQHDSLVTGLSQDIQLADLGERGIWYRVRIGPFATRDSASSLCEQLQSEGANCFVAAP